MQETKSKRPGGRRTLDDLVEVEGRPGLVVARQLRPPDDADEAHGMIDAIEHACRRHATGKVILDARGSVGEWPEHARDALFARLAAPDRALLQLAFVLTDEMRITRLDMTAVARRADARAFSSPTTAKQWLQRPARRTASGRIRASAETLPGTRRARARVWDSPGFRAPARVDEETRLDPKK